MKIPTIVLDFILNLDMYILWWQINSSCFMYFALLKKISWKLISEIDSLLSYKNSSPSTNSIYCPSFCLIASYRFSSKWKKGIFLLSSSISPPDYPVIKYSRMLFTLWVDRYGSFSKTYISFFSENFILLKQTFFLSCILKTCHSRKSVELIHSPKSQGQHSIFSIRRKTYFIPKLKMYW